MNIFFSILIVVVLFIVLIVSTTIYLGSRKDKVSVEHNKRVKANLKKNK